jgi:hypothetical protein
LGFKAREEQLWEGDRCKTSRDLVEDRWAPCHGFLKIDGKLEVEVKKEVLWSVLMSYNIYFEVVRERNTNGLRGDAFLEAVSRARRKRFWKRPGRMTSKTKFRKPL